MLPSPMEISAFAVQGDRYRTNCVLIAAILRNGHRDNHWTMVHYDVSALRIGSEKCTPVPRSDLFVAHSRPPCALMID
jgi:hypothetical protein